MSDAALIAITGASGFIGSAVVRSLRSAGRRFVAFGSRPHDAQENGEAWESLDLLNAAAVRQAMAFHRPGILIHTAWARARAGGLWQMDENWAWRDSSLGLFDAFWAAGGRQVVSCGTCAEYAETGDDCVEGVTPLRPESIYGQAKAQLHETAAERAEQLGTILTWARLFYLFGPNEGPARLVPSVIDKLLAGIPAETGAGLVERDFALVDDVAAGLVALADNAPGGAYNVASGTGIRQRRLVELIGEIMDAADLLRIGALPDRPGEFPRIVADVSRIARDTGWTAGTSLEEGLRRTIAWRRSLRPATG